MKTLIKTAALAALLASALTAQAATTGSAPLPSVTAQPHKSVMANLPAEFPPAASFPEFTILPSGTTAAVTFVHGIDNLTLKGSMNTPALLNIANPAEILPPSLKSGVARCTLTADGGESVFAGTEARPYFRAGDLSCFDKAGKLVDKAYVQGYLVGDDGNLGLPAHVVKAGMKATLVVKEDGKVFEFSHQ